MQVWSSIVSRIKPTLVSIGDHVVPKTPSVVLRTFPDFDDQGRALLPALREMGIERVVWLVNNVTQARPDIGVAPDGLRVFNAGSARGIIAYWRATTVVHTHGVYGVHRGSRRKTFVNIWHGMPIKRLDSGTGMGPHQTDVTIATSDIHASNLSLAWDLTADQVRITGLPRNDVMLRATTSERLRERKRDIASDAPLVLWLPTYRSSALGQIRRDGKDFGNPFQLPDASAEEVNEALKSAGVHAILKVHQMATLNKPEQHSNLTVWSDRDLYEAGLTLYELLSQADILISDQSSVWVDFLLLQRPIIFSIADMEEYERTRGYYFSPLRPSLPGPLVASLQDLVRELKALVRGDDEWRQARSDALALHHVHRDARSGLRVACEIQHHLARS